MCKYIYNDIKKNKILYYITAILFLFSFIAVKPNLENSIIENIANSLSNEKLLFLCFFEISIFITYYINNYFSQNYILKIRYLDKTEYIKIICKINFKFQILLLFLLLIIVMIFQNIFSYQTYNIEIINQLEVLNIIYLLYKILQILFLILVLSKILILLLNANKEKLSFILVILFIFSNLINFYLIEVDLTRFSLLIGNSILNTYTYSSFFINIIDYLFHLLIFITVERVINYVFYNKEKFKQFK